MADAYVQAFRLKAFAPVFQQVSNIRFRGPASPRTGGDAAGCLVGADGRSRVAGNKSSNSEAYATSRSIARPRGRLRSFALLALAWSQLALAGPAPSGWESPFQAGTPDAVRDKLIRVPAERCDRDPYNKCTFTAPVDYDGNGTADIVRMVDGRGVSALVVEFAGKPKRTMTIASFKGRWTGSCYIEPDRSDRTAVAFICPESSAATFKMRNGKPAVRWTGD